MPETLMRNKDKTNELEEVLKKIKGLASFSEIEGKDNLGYFMKEDGGADIVAQAVAKEMKINQLRMFFEKIKKIQRKYKEGKQENSDIAKVDLYPLLPELAYAYGRGLMTKEVYELLKVCISEKVNKLKDLNSFVDFLAAVIAYHKFHEKEKG